MWLAFTSPLRICIYIYYCHDKISAKNKACNLKQSLEMAVLNIQEVAAFIVLTSALPIKDQFLTEMLTASQGTKEVSFF